MNIRAIKNQLPDVLEYGGFTYHLYDEPLRKGDWYIDHEKYHLGMDPVEECNLHSLACFINERVSGWYSRKIKSTDDPVVSKSYL